MAANDRWPKFDARAAELGVRSLLSFQLFVQSENLGALNIYGGEPGVFSADSTEIGLILAQHAAVAMVGPQHRAISNRVWPAATSSGKQKAS